jgi:Uma2 family endonuclease
MQVVIPDLERSNVSQLPDWQPATWEDYLVVRDAVSTGENRDRIFFDRNWLLVLRMSTEGITHALICDLLTMIFGFWLTQQPEQTFTSLGRCLIEQPGLQAGAPDLVIYRGPDYPRWQPGEKRRIDLSKMRLPDLVGEISDTTLATDLDEKKRLYRSMGIPEYWVIDVQGQRVFMFRLAAGDRGYVEIPTSECLPGLSVELITQALQKTRSESNGTVALWALAQMQAGEKADLP